MAETGGSERLLLGQSARSQAKYGTTVTTASTGPRSKSVSAMRESKFIKHIVVKGETLMGISLKYNVTVEQLKRENKLWTNDSLFLREYLLVPLTPDNEEGVSPESIVVIKDRDRSGSFSDKSTEEEQVASKDVAAKDFLSKYDSTIAQLKSNVERLEKNASKSQTHRPPRRHNLGSKFELPVDPDTEC